MTGTFRGRTRNWEAKAHYHFSLVKLSSDWFAAKYEASFTIICAIDLSKISVDIHQWGLPVPGQKVCGWPPHSLEKGRTQEPAKVPVLCAPVTKH